MPVIDRRGQPLPKDHPFSGTRIIFGAKRPSSSAKPSETPEQSSAQPDPMQPAADAVEAFLKSEAEFFNMDERQSRIKQGNNTT